MATQTLVPTSLRDPSNAWKNPAGDGCQSAGTCQLEVDEGIGATDGDTSYVQNTYTTGNYRTDCRNSAGAFSVPGGSTIEKVSLSISIKKLGSSPRGKVYIGDGEGTLYYADDFSTVGASYETRTNDWLTNPKTSAAWQVNEVNGTDSTLSHRLNVNGDATYGYYGWGPRSNLSNDGIRVSTIDLTVTYTGGGDGGAAIFTPYDEVII